MNTFDAGAKAAWKWAQTKVPYAFKYDREFKKWLKEMEKNHA